MKDWGVEGVLEHIIKMEDQIEQKTEMERGQRARWTDGSIEVDDSDVND